MKLKKFVILLASFMIVGGVLSEAKVVRADSQNIVDVRSVGQSNISTFSTNKGDAGITKLEIQNKFKIEAEGFGGMQNLINLERFLLRG